MSRDVIIRIGGEAVAGIRTTRLAFSREVFDASPNSLNYDWQRLHSEKGRKRLAVSGSGVVLNTAVMYDALSANAPQAMELIVDDGTKYEGDFFLTSLELRSAFNGAPSWSLSLRSAGDITTTSRVMPVELGTLEGAEGIPITWATNRVEIPT